jgi:hypothetical protein
MTMNTHHASALLSALALLLLPAVPAGAQDSAEVVDRVELPEPTDPYGPVQEVEVIEHPGYTLEEFRVQGRREWIRVTPRNAPSLYMNDRTGIGTMSDPNGDLDSTINVPKWRLGQW